MNDKIAQKKTRHRWVSRPDCPWLSYCGLCGIYEDTVVRTRPFHGGVEAYDATVLRPYKDPKKVFVGNKKPPCNPIENGKAKPPPPRKRGEVMKAALEAVSKSSD